jgi:hypothetical protein
MRGASQLLGERETAKPDKKAILVNEPAANANDKPRPVYA